MRAGHGQLVFACYLAIHSLVLESIFAHLEIACVLASLRSLLFHLLTHSRQGLLEFLHGHTAILIQIELFHEHLNFFLEGREAIRLRQELLDFVGSDRATAIFINSSESVLEFLIGEDIDAESVDKIRLE